MKFPIIEESGPPPQAMSMEEYAEFVEFFLRDADKDAIKRQREREGHINKPFRLTEENHQPH